MKPIYEKFWCPQCGQIRYINVNGICSSCNIENELERISFDRSTHKLFSI